MGLNSVRRLKRLGYQVILARGATRNAADQARYIESQMGSDGVAKIARLLAQTGIEV